MIFLFQDLSLWNKQANIELYLFLFLLLGVLILWWCAEINLWEAIYGTICCYAAQHIAYALYDILHTALFPRLWYFTVYLFCIENYYDGTLKLEHGLPVTTRDHPMDHGYGMRSIQEIAQKYGGSISVDMENQIFLLSILLPP